MGKRLPLLFLGDILLSALAAGLWVMAWPARVLGLAAGHVLHWKEAAFFVLVTIFASYLAEFYSSDSSSGGKLVFPKSLLTFGISLCGLAVFYLFRPLYRSGLGWGLGTLVFFCLAQFFWHIAFNAFQRIPRFASKVLVMGTGPLAHKIGGVIEDSPESGHVLHGYYRCNSEDVHVPSGSVVKNGDGLRAVVRREKPRKIVVSLTDRRGALPVEDMLHCKFSGIEVVDAPSFYEDMTGKLLIENLRPSWFIFSDGFRITPAIKVMKRVSDIFFSTLGLALASPVMLLLVPVIKLDSRGPVFFKQTRMGEKERLFTIYKFRTMRADAEKGTGAVWATKRDPRITRVGGFLRKTRLDELMQLFNVLKGDMSFVGPRPERPEFVEELKTAIPYYSERHFVKPGVTGWAQVRFPYGASIEDALEKLRYDLYYIKNLSFSLDMYIILETIKVVLFKKGAR